MSGNILEVTNLEVSSTAHGRTVTPVDGVSLAIRPGEALGIAGESGSGKSLTLRSIVGLLPPNASIAGDLRCALDEHEPHSEDEGDDLVQEMWGLTLQSEDEDGESSGMSDMESEVSEISGDEGGGAMNAVEEDDDAQGTHTSLLVENYLVHDSSGLHIFNPTEYIFYILGPLQSAVN